MLIPLAMLAACGPDEDDSNAATGNSTSDSISASPDGSASTNAAGGTGANQTTNSGATGSVNDSNSAGGTGNASGAGGSTGSGTGSGAGSNDDASGSGDASDSGDDSGSGDPGSAADPGSSGGSGDSGDPGGSGGATTPGFGTAALNVSTQTVFGFGVGPASVGDVLDEVSTQLGPVTNDTDWYTLPRTGSGGTGDCLAEQESRILRWGDLSIAFWRKDGAESIWSWSVGDPAVSGYGDRREPNIPASPAATGLRTAEGVSVGSTFADVYEAYDEQFQFFPSTPDDASGIHLATSATKTPAGAGMSLMEVDDLITGIGSALAIC